MRDSETTVYVFDDFIDIKPTLMGRLYADWVEGYERFSFEFDSSWLLKNRNLAPLDAELLYDVGRQHSEYHGLFGLFFDSFPERLGRFLIDSQERVFSKAEGRNPEKLSGTDYLLRAGDRTRVGGLRFKTEMDGPFLWDDSKTPRSTEENLPELETLFRDYETKFPSDVDACGARLLDLGAFPNGSRPKACVTDSKGSWWIAKFPSKKDDNDIGAWEMVTHALSSLCGLNVPEAKLKRFSEFGSTFLTKRFDRESEKRIHFSTALTLLKKADVASGAYRLGLLDLADFIKAYGSDQKNDLRELWKRMVFDLAVRNTDNYLRNHGFLFTKKGWKLAPFFDCNPDASDESLSLHVNAKDEVISLDRVLEAALEFEISASEARRIAESIFSTVEIHWEGLARRYGLGGEQIEKMRPAFVRKS